ncbi:MAG: BrnT family toxin [bacterium]
MKNTQMEEERYFALGKTNNNRLLFTVFTVRENKICVISSRDMNKNERKINNEKAKENTEV